MGVYQTSLQYVFKCTKNLIPLEVEMKLKTLLVSLGLGAGLMYFLDPQQGNRRRALVRDRVNGVVNSLDYSLDTATQDMRNRTRGVLSEMLAKLSDQGTPDWILEERVRTALGRLSRHARTITVEADGGGYIHLSGPVLREERYDIVKTAERTRGVYGVEDRLQAFDNPQDIPALQRSPSEQQAAPEGGQQNWSPAARLLGGVGGSLLTLYGLKRHGLTKPLLSTAGLILTTRSVTNMDTRSLIGSGEKAIKVRKGINIDAPIDEVYRFWRNFENFTQFMSHVKEISVHDDISTWKVAGPAGTTVEYQSQITRDIPNQLIAWETLPTSEVRHSGFVRFDPSTTGGTRVSVQMDYIPPAGALGHAVAHSLEWTRARQ